MLSFKIKKTLKHSFQSFPSPKKPCADAELDLTRFRADFQAEAEAPAEAEDEDEEVVAAAAGDDAAADWSLLAAGTDPTTSTAGALGLHR